jgi:Bacterial PH domain
MASLERLLAPEERVHLVTREHGMVLAPAFLRALAGLTALGLLAHAAAATGRLGPLRVGVAVVAGALALVVIARLLRAVTAWHVRRLVVTDRRALLLSGGLSRRVAVVPLDTIEEIAVRRSAPGRLLRYGSLVVVASGRRGPLFGLRQVPDPDLVFGLVLGLDGRIPSRPRRRPPMAVPASASATR